MQITEVTSVQKAKEMRIRGFYSFIQNKVLSYVAPCERYM